MMQHSVDIVCKSPARLHTMPYFPGEERLVPSHKQQTQTLDCFRCRANFFPFFFTGISKQTETELAVRQLHGAGRAAVSSHDPSLTQSDWGLQGRLQGRLQSGAGERLETEGRQKQEGKRAQVLYGTFKGHFMVLGLFWRWGGFTEKRWRRGEIMSQIRGRVVTSRCFRVSSQRAGWKLFLLRQHLLNSKDTDTWEIRICSAGKCC